MVPSASSGLCDPAIPRAFSIRAPTRVVRRYPLDWFSYRLTHRPTKAQCKLGYWRLFPEHDRLGFCCGDGRRYVEQSVLESNLPVGIELVCVRAHCCTSGAVPKFTLKRAHQIVTARYFERSAFAGRRSEEHT